MRPLSVHRMRITCSIHHWLFSLFVCVCFFCVACPRLPNESEGKGKHAVSCIVWTWTSRKRLFICLSNKRIIKRFNLVHTWSSTAWCVDLTKQVLAVDGDAVRNDLLTKSISYFSFTINDLCRMFCHRTTPATHSSFHSEIETIICYTISWLSSVWGRFIQWEMT